MNNGPEARIAFIGGGNMARALIGGLIRGGVPGTRITVGEPDEAARRTLERDFAVRTDIANAEAVRDASLVVLAVKPQVVAAVLSKLHGAWPEPPPLLLSIVAGLRCADLARLCRVTLPIVRAMPNRPALVGAGVTGLYAAGPITTAQRLLAERVAGAAGRFVWLRAEAEIDIVTALSGSGPAYFFLLAEQLARAAAELGIESSTAQLLATQTLYGSGVLARDGASLAEQRAAVTSAGGTTQAALEHLEAGGFTALIGGALRAAARRSAELAEIAAAGPKPPGNV